MANEKMIRGDSRILNVDVRLGGYPFVLTGYTAWFTAKYSYADADSAAVVKKGNSGGLTGLTFVNDPITGAISRMKIAILPADTSSLPSKTVNLKYDVQIKSPTGTVITLCRGDLDIEPDVTNSTV